MHLLAKFFPSNRKGENPVAVKMFYIMSSVKNIFYKRRSKEKIKWPAVEGNYLTGNPTGKVAVCTLTTNDLMEPVSKWDEVAIAGKVYTPNLGIEKIILNVISNSNIRFLLLCGKDSPVFHAGQALQSMFHSGINKEKRIINAIGHFPVLRNISKGKIEQFLQQIELIDCTGETDIKHLKNKVSELAERNTGIYYAENGPLKIEEELSEEEKFIELKPGGKRVSLDYDSKGFFVITTDLKSKQITVKHYYKDNKAGHIIHGHSAESILLAILQKELVSQLTHAGYLGAELSKAETAIKLNLKYEQDQPLCQ